MDLSRHYEEFVEALLHAFSQAELEMLVRFRLNFDLDSVVGPGPLRQRVFELIAYCDREGLVDKLFVEALNKRPNNPKLKALAKTLEKEISAQQRDIVSEVNTLINKDYENPQADQIRNAFAKFETNNGLQAVVVRAAHLDVGQDAVDWQTRQTESLTRICSIAGPKLGTGFLIGTDRILTNSHVIIEGRHAEYNGAFDYFKGTNRDALPKYKFTAELARSGPRDFDYVILKLDRPVEAKRGYFRPKKEHKFLMHEPVSVLGHPNGNPLSFAYGVILDANSFMGRVAYTANTAGGSSGSPVFLENWELAAVHHHGEENVNNHGIPLSKIIKDLESKGLAHLIELAP